MSRGEPCTTNVAHVDVETLISGRDRRTRLERRVERHCKGSPMIPYHAIAQRTRRLP